MTFIALTRESIPQLVAQVLYLCDRQGLSAREMFAIDGVKLPSKASQARSGMRADFAREAARLESAVAQMLARHRDSDLQSAESTSTVRIRSLLERTASRH